MTPATTLEGAHVLVVGGGSGMGLAIALAAAAAGARLTLAGRTPDKLAAAAGRVGPGTRTLAFDAGDPAQVRDAMAAAGELDHLVVTAAAPKGGPIWELAFEDALATMRGKFWGPYLCAAHARVRPGGSVTLFSGVLSRRPAAGQVVLGCVNAAVEALGRALALELAPVRVNTISPGLVDSGAYDRMEAGAREAMFAATAKRLPAGRVGRPEDVAAAALMLMANPYVTGATLDVDGGALVAP